MDGPGSEYRIISAEAVDSGLIRQESGWLVLPTVAVKPMVLQCTGCAPPGEYLPAEEIAKSLPAWNGVPITIGHPVRDGSLVSVNSTREVRTAEEIGQLWNVNVKDGALHGEIWLAPNQVKQHAAGAALLQRVTALMADPESGTMDVSTGYFRRAENVAGEEAGVAFASTQRDLLPDHLAILEEGVPGACSVQDGCGAPRANRSGLSCNCPGANMEPERPGALAGLWHWFKRRLMAQELSHGDIRDLLRTELVEQDGGEGVWIWIVDVYDDYIVYELESDNEVAYFKRSYTLTEGENAASSSVELADDAVEVERVVEYREVTNPEGNMENREAVINELAGCECVALNKEQLTALSDEALQAFKDQRDARVAAEAAAGGNPTPTGNEGDGTPASAEAIATAVTAQMEEKYGLSALASERSERVANEQALKDRLIEELKANDRCIITEPTLKLMALSELQRYHRQLTGARAPTNYLAQGTPIQTANGDAEKPFAESEDFMAAYRKDDNGEAQGAAA